MCKQLLQEKKKVAGFISALLFTSASSNPITLEQEGYLQIINAETVPLRQYFSPMKQEYEFQVIPLQFELPQ